MLWFGIVISLCYIPGWTGAYIATQWVLLSIILPISLLYKGFVTVYHLFGLLFLIYAVIRFPFSPVLDISVWGLWLIIIMGLCLWFGTLITDLKQLYIGLAIGATVSSAVAVFQFFGYHPLPFLTTNPPGLYVNSIQQGEILGLIAIALITERMWIWLPGLIPGFVLAESRGAFLAVAIGLVACFVRRLWIFGILGVAGVAFLLLPLSSSDAERMQIWHTIINNLTLLGNGPGVLFAMILRRPDGQLYFPEYAHNDVLQLAFEYGLMAMVPVAIFAHGLWRTDTKQWPILMAFATMSSYSMPLYMPITAFLALVCLGHILRLDALDGRLRDYSRSIGLSRKQGTGSASNETISLASIYTIQGNAR